MSLFYFFVVFIEYLKFRTLYIIILYTSYIYNVYKFYYKHVIYVIFFWVEVIFRWYYLFVLHPFQCSVLKLKRYNFSVKPHLNTYVCVLYPHVDVKCKSHKHPSHVSLCFSYLTVTWQIQLTSIIVTVFTFFNSYLANNLTNLKYFGAEYFALILYLIIFQIIYYAK